LFVEALRDEGTLAQNFGPTVFFSSNNFPGPMIHDFLNMASNVQTTCTMKSPIVATVVVMPILVPRYQWHRCLTRYVACLRKFEAIFEKALTPCNSSLWELFFWWGKTRVRKVSWQGPFKGVLFYFFGFIKWSREPD
jgi:hypothetical protein